MLKILQARLEQYMNYELPDVQAGFRKGRKPEIKLPTSVGLSKKQKRSRKTSTSALLTMPKPLTGVEHDKLWKILKEMEIPGHLRYLDACQEALVRTGHGTDWFQIGKGVCQGCILSPCLFNLLQSTS